MPDVFAEVCKEEMKLCLVFYLDAAVQMQIPELFYQDFSPSDHTGTYTHVCILSLAKSTLMSLEGSLI